MEPVYLYRAVCERVVDGDTFVATIDVGFRVSITIPIRLHGVNAPEHNKPGGSEATGFLKNLIEGKELLIQSFKDRRSFERWVADVWVSDDQLTVSARIIDAGHGVEFMA